jgi:WD40 repeat protein
VWDLASGREVRALTRHFSRVMAVTPDGKMAVSASCEYLEVWNLQRAYRFRMLPGFIGRKLRGRVLRALYGHRESVRAVAVTSDGQRAVSASYDNTLKVWDLASGRELRTLTGHSAWVTGVAVTPDGQLVVSA